MSVHREPDVKLTSLSRGAGCACKLPLEKLESMFDALGADLLPASGELMIGALDGDDAAVYRMDDDRAIILTTDFFTPVVDDPRDWGRVAAANALSDVYAMGGEPLLAVNLAAWPGADLSLDLLADVLRGGADVALEARCFVAGGHTIDDPIPKYGMAVVGQAHPDNLFRIDGLRVGDRLVLTKGIGTGVIATAIKNGDIDDKDAAGAIDSMTTLNAAASRVARNVGVVAATDVTGFGLAGHLHRMAVASGVAARLAAADLPLLPGATDAIARGYVPGGTRANTKHLASKVTIDADVSAELATLVHDAQTSGGLLLAVPADVDPAPVVQELREHDLPAAVIGEITPGESGRITVTAGR